MSHKLFPWSEFFILFGMGLIGAMAIVPYFISIIMSRAEKNLKSLIRASILQLLQSLIFVGAASAAGLAISHDIGLGAPLIEGWLAGEEVKSRLFHMAIVSLSLGISTGSLIWLIDFLLFLPQSRQLWSALAAPLWQRFLACFYGGITEELIMRLFLFSIVAWLLGQIWHTSEKIPTIGVFWTANTIVAIIFALGHLPATARLTSITPPLIMRTLLLNGLASLVFGYLYWQYGLEAAMLAHFVTDVILQVAGSALLRVLLR